MFFAQRLWCFFARFSIINWAIGFARFSLINGETPFFLMSAGIMLFWKKHYIFSKNRVKIQTMQDGKYSWDRWGAIQIFPTLDVLTAEKKSTGFVCWLVIANCKLFLASSIWVGLIMNYHVYALLLVYYFSWFTMNESQFFYFLSLCLCIDIISSSVSLDCC